MTRPIAAILVLSLCGAYQSSVLAETPAARFIPLELIVGANWSGAPAISYPQGTFHEGIVGLGASTWTGPRSWVHPKTGKTMMVYDRSRGGHNPAVQIFAVREDQTAIGRVANSRFGISACDQEAKYPLGPWVQGERRSFDYTCWYGDTPRAQVTTLSILDIDFEYDGRQHCLKEEWLLQSKSDARTLDHRVYIFAPDIGVVREYQIR